MTAPSHRSPSRGALRAVLVFAGALLLFSAGARAQTLPTYDIPWYTMDGGGGSSAGGDLALDGTIGQADAGGALTGGVWDAYSGFWHPYNIPCAIDFNGSGMVTMQDLFDFLSAFFAHSPTADFNASGQVTVQDLFDFLLAWFAGCA